MRSEDVVRAEYDQLRAKFGAAFQRKARSREGSPSWEEAEREIGRLDQLGTALGWVLAEIDDVETIHFPSPHHALCDAPPPLGQYWRDQLGDLVI